MQKTIKYNLNVNINEVLPVLPPMHDYALTNIVVEDDRIVFTTDDFVTHDYDYTDIVGFHPKSLSIKFCELCDIGVVEVLRFYAKKQFGEKHKDFIDAFGSRVNNYYLTDFVKFFKEYHMQFNYFSVSSNEVIVFFHCNNPKNKAREVIIKINCEKVIYTFTE